MTDGDEAAGFAVDEEVSDAFGGSIPQPRISSPLERSPNAPHFLRP